MTETKITGADLIAAEQARLNTAEQRVKTMENQMAALKATNADLENKLAEQKASNHSLVKTIDRLEKTVATVRNAVA